MAGAGYKLFNTGDVLTAAQVNTYLQEQVVMVFANAAARTTALSGVLAEGMVSYLKDTDALEIYSGSAWVSYGSGDITGITTGATSGLTGGVTSGTADLKFNTTAKGGLLVGTGSGTVSELAVGSNAQVLTADSTTATGLKWATSTTGGMTLLSTTTLTSTTVTIGSIDQSYKHLFLYCKEVTASSNGESLQLRFNGDTATNYYYDYVRNIGTTVTGAFNNENKIQLIDRIQSSATVSKYGSCGFWIYRYTSTDWIDGQGQSLGHDGSSGYGSSISFRYDTSAAITSITLFPSGTATQGGTAYLYGVN